MNPITRQRLNRIFLSWLVIANLLWMATPATGLTHWLGDAALWTLIMPGCCLVALNTRRSVGMVLGTLGLLTLALWRLVPDWPRRAVDVA